MSNNLLFMIYDNDKTPEYGYHGKSRFNSVGLAPGVAKRFKTPKELIRDYIGADFWKLYNKYKEETK
jgi:hypothetical protein